jgi:dihydrofolate reductase
MNVRFAVFIAASLDGYVARPDGGLDWLAPFEGEEHGYLEFLAGVDALVIGRGTYDTVLGFPEWPYRGKRVIVCTRRALAARHGEEFWAGSPRALAERLDGEGVRRVYLDGGALISSFLRESLVEEMSIHLIPVLLGAGIRLFGAGFPEMGWRLLEAKSYPSGLVQLRYARAG